VVDLSPAKAKAIERVKKLLALADNDGATLAEAELAMQRAQEIMDKHRIERDDLRTPTVDDMGGLNVEIPVDSRFPWVTYLASGIADLNCTRCLSTGSDHYLFIGAEHDTEITVYFFDYLRRTILRLADNMYSSAQSAIGWHEFATEFGIGAAMRILARLHERQRARVHDDENLGALVRSNSQALARFIADAFPTPVKDRDVSEIVSQQPTTMATVLGMAAGADVALNNAVEEGKKPAAELD